VAEKVTYPGSLFVNYGGCDLTLALRQAETKVIEDSGGNTVGIEHI